MGEHNDSIQLLENISMGSRHSFDLFYEKHISFVFQIALHVTGNRAEAEDVCHDVFLEVYQKADQYQVSKGSVEAWLAIRTKSRALDRVRKKKPILRDKLEELLSGEEKGADKQFLSELEKDTIIEALKHLPKEQREAIYRSYFREETHKEIASTMNRPLGSVKSLIRYGLNNLRKQKSIFSRIDSNGGEKDGIL
ncbi:RNA polymerase sigma factor [Lentibacillus sp.]|uniref:RNA polymerase sigma factor n=1 Tax=Lentibacillus sp. TaxID=1925746 RepID=UPI002B4B3C6B|nr:RNA polymerase sigma factor [Lentibacillus sp.]HLS10485.1 RNA polymerase sigma factor [Lentibacillus sp.]